MLTTTEEGKGKAKKYGFNIRWYLQYLQLCVDLLTFGRFMQMTRFAERAFMLDTESERVDWIRAYSEASRRFDAIARAAKEDCLSPLH